MMNTFGTAGRMTGRSSSMHMIISTPASAQANASFMLLVRISVNVRPLFFAANRSWMVSFGMGVISRRYIGTADWRMKQQNDLKSENLESLLIGKINTG